MIASAEFDSAFERARQLHAQGRIIEAEQTFKQLAAAGENREAALRALVELYMHAGRVQEAIETMVALTEQVPDRLYYYARLAALLEGRDELDRAIEHYSRLLRRMPQLAEAHFNLALLYKKSKRFSEALDSYQQAIKLGINGAEEVWSNMGVLYAELRQQDKAGEMYERALEAKPDYVPALFNLAGLREEAGERQQAIAIYERILALQPRCWEALTLLTHARKFAESDRRFIDSLRQALNEANDNPAAKESLYFALGKALDDLGQYDEAFAAYRAANELGTLRNPGYDRRGIEQAFDRLIDLFSRDWLQRASSGSASRPIFICGMFRSGSTLIEQILASHPSVTAGGELDYLPWLVQQRLAPYPDRLASASRLDLEELGKKYLSLVRSTFPDAVHVTDKRPDNFLRLGLIKALFPAARIIYTKRNPVDNYLSIYFQQLSGNLGYATDLWNIEHYYRQHVRLMTHWINCFESNIFTVDYDELVSSPEPVIRRLLEFLGLEWDDRCLSFQQTGNLVKTASLWQVREELHSRSSGRWKNYARYVVALAETANSGGMQA